MKPEFVCFVIRRLSEVNAYSFALSFWLLFLVVYEESQQTFKISEAYIRHLSNESPHHFAK